MGMACEAEARPTTAGAPVSPVDVPQDGTNVDVEMVGKCESTEERERRLRSNSEETALILTSMMSIGGFVPPPKSKPSTAGVSDDDDDMGEDEDMSDDELDNTDDRPGTGKGKRRGQSPHGSKNEMMDEAGFNHRFRNESNRVKSLVTKHISIDELREHFDRPIIDVAKDFGICITLMKKICRRNGIKRWPHRQIRSLSKSIASMEAAMLSAQGSERDKYRDQIVSLTLKRDAVIADPNKENSMMSRPKTPTKDTPSMRQHAHAHAAPKLSPRADTLAGGASPDVAGRTKSDSNQVNSKGGRWTSEEHAAFLHGIRLYGKDWRRVAQVVRTRSAVQTRTHAQKYLLKFAGRFPFDAESMEIKDQPDLLHETPVVGDGEQSGIVPGSGRDEDFSSKADSTTNTSISAHGNDSSQPEVSVKKSALEAMAMILNSPQFKSYRDMAPSPLKIEPPLGDSATETHGPLTNESPSVSNLSLSPSKSPEPTDNGTVAGPP